MSFRHLVVERASGGWAEVTLSRPEVLNALNLAMVRELEDCLSELEEEAGLCGVIFTGAGEKAFVAGADIGELLERGLDEALQGINARLFQRIEDFPRPTLAAMRGYALGGGLELALACDMRLGTPGSVVGQPEVKLGIIPGAGGPHRLSRTVGPGLARELIFTGRMMQADEALRAGLLNRIVDEGALMDAAREVMTQIGRNSPLAVRLAKTALNAAANSADRRHQMLEVMTQGILFEDEEKRRRMQRFLERRRRKEQDGGDGGSG